MSLWILSSIHPNDDPTKQYKRMPERDWTREKRRNAGSESTKNGYSQMLRLRLATDIKLFVCVCGKIMWKHALAPVPAHRIIYSCVVLTNPSSDRMQCADLYIHVWRSFVFSSPTFFSIIARCIFYIVGYTILWSDDDDDGGNCEMNEMVFSRCNFANAYANICNRMVGVLCESYPSCAFISSRLILVIAINRMDI